MKKIGKRMFSFVLSVVLCITTFLSTMPIDAAINLGRVETQPGKALNYTFDKTSGLLTISCNSGTGNFDMYDFTDLKKPPWINDKQLIKKVVINEGVTGIGSYAFFNCTNLTTVVLPSSIKSIRSSLLSSTGSGIGDDSTQNNVSYGAFRGCTNLTTINLPEGLEEIGIAVFRDCTSLKSVVLPDSLKKMGRGAFIGCTSIQEVTFGNGLTETTSQAFYNCKNIKTINWGNISKVSEWSFYNTGLEQIDLPDQIKTISARAFANCAYLDTVTIRNRQCAIEDLAFDNVGVSGNQKLTICGYIGSTAEEFAKKRNYEFQSLDNCKHENTHINILKPATCTEDGLQEVYCDQCNNVIEPNVVIPATGHDFEITSTKDDTTTDGHIREFRKCKTCGFEDVKLTHVEAEDSTNLAKKYIWVDGYYTYECNATCTTPGWEKYTCTVDGCGATQRNAVRKAGHKVDKWTVTKAPTCTEAGSRTGHCSVCNKDVTEAVEKKGHTLDTEHPVKVEDKTETDGHKYSTYACTVCGEQVVQKEHTAWVENYYTRDTYLQPGCETNGYRRDTCDICGEKRTVTLPSNGGHKWEEIETIEPTCNSKGYTTAKCSVCGTTKKINEVEALGHKYVLQKDKVVKATCTEAGSKTYVCSRCSASKTDVVPALGHVPSSSTIVVKEEATCEKDGSAHATCARCKVEYDYVIKALGHDYKNNEVELPDKPGHVLSTPICNRCGQKENATVVHKEWIEGYYEHKVLKEATCRVGEVYVDTCKICKQTTPNTQGSPLGYVFEMLTVYEEPTATAIGDNIKVEPYSIVYKCKHCQSIETKTGHDVFYMWDSHYLNLTPDARTSSSYASYLDVNKDGIINGKDFATIYQLSKKYDKYKAEQQQPTEQQTTDK